MDSIYEGYDFGYDATPVADWFETCEHNVSLERECKRCDDE